MLKIIYTDDNTIQIITPNPQFFDGDWKKLAAAIAGDRNYTYEVK